MLSDELKQTIQQAYRTLLQNKGMKPRWGQRVMIAEIAKMLSEVEADADGKRDSEAPFCVVEAGTGTGKTVAYILAVLPVAKAMGKHVVISTATVALQEQIVFRDLPDILHHSGLQFSFGLAKGRGRYLCLSKLDNILQSNDAQNPTLALYPDEILPPTDESALALYQTMLESLGSGAWDGDRDNWPQDIENDYWQAVTTDRNQCSGRRCAHVSQCSFFKARDNVQNMDCIVANHDLVLSDLALGGGAILADPADTIYIFDEGHHLPERALRHFSSSTRMKGSQRWLEQLQKNLNNLTKQLSILGSVTGIAKQIPSVAEELRQFLGLLVPQLEQLMPDSAKQQQRRDPGQALASYRFAHGEVPEEFQALATEIMRRYMPLVDNLQRLHKLIGEYLEEEDCPVPKDAMDAAYAAVGQQLARAEAHYSLWCQFAVSDPQGALPKARWLTAVEALGQIDIELNASPILAQQQLQQYLWSRCFAAVVTSATMTSLGSFDRFVQASGIPDGTAFAVVASPFDYAGAAVFNVPMMACEPNAVDEHTASVAELLPGLLDAHKGSLVLFASRRQMLEVYGLLERNFRSAILVQGDYSKAEIIRKHCEAIDAGKSSIIFGLASFAEGVDLPGEYCTHVVIAKLPFGVPGDPLESALAEWIEQQGGNAFMEIAVPDAALRLVQAAGRLLRSEQDRGEVTLLDRRVVSKRYGKQILKSLPPFTINVA